MSLESKTQALARNNVFAGRPDQMVIDLAHYQAVTKEEVMRVYRKYVRGKHFVALSTVPQGQTSLALTGSVVVRPDEDSPVGQKLVAGRLRMTIPMSIRRPFSTVRWNLLCWQIRRNRRCHPYGPVK